MTRSITLTNTSNHDEDLDLQIGHLKRSLKRGESFKMGYAEVVGIVVSDGEQHDTKYLGELEVFTEGLPSGIGPGSMGWAIGRMKMGAEMRRKGWNGKGMYIYMESFSCQEKSPQYQPCITMHTAQGTEQRGWLASQADLLADDWEHV